MMKTSVFALDQRGSGGGEGCGRRKGLALLTSAICWAWRTDPRVPSTMQVVTHPGKGEINRWGSLPRRSLSLEGSPDFARGTVRFRVVCQCSQQRALSLGTALGLRRRRKGEQPANFQVGKEGGEGGGEQLAGGLQTVKFALPPGRDLPEQRNYTTSLGKARLCFPKPTLFPAMVAFTQHV